MRKLLCAMALIPCLSFASSLDMNNLKCRNLKLNASTTLKQVQDSCLIKKQKMDDGLYEVKFENDATGKIVKCYFASEKPGALLNSCK